MRMFDAEPQIIQDLRDEGDVIAEKERPDFKVYAVRHPTLGKVVIVQGADGSGWIVETEE
jgi:hypothetical protein